MIATLFIMYANTALDIIIQAVTKIYALVLYGTISPYPTVTIVTIAQ
jgi:hypothetical protein